MSHRQASTSRSTIESGQPPDRTRWLAAGLVIAAVLLIMGVKMLGTPAGGLTVVETPSVATMPPLTALPPMAVAQPTVAQADNPFPSNPAAQVDWVLQNGKPALILFHSTNCKPCIAMSALVESIRPAYEHQVVFIDVVTNDAANAALVRRVGIRSIPTTFFISSSGSGQGYIGLMKEEDVRTELDRILTKE